MRVALAVTFAAVATAPWSLACVDRSDALKTSAADDDSASSEVVTSSGPTPSSSASTAVDGGPTGPTGGSDGEEPYLDCRPLFYDPFARMNCAQTYGAYPSDSWSSFACNTCICVETCEQDADCIDRGAPVPPTCFTAVTNPDFQLCVLLCGADEECPGEMVCLYSEQLGDSACFLPWVKPQCCELSGTNC
jgi:hypothetical protein